MTISVDHDLFVFKKTPGHSHIHRAIYGDPFDGSYDITGPQMVLVMKLTTFAWNVWDGRRPVQVRHFAFSFSSLPPNPLYCLYMRVGFRQMADEHAGHQISFINRVLRILVRGPSSSFLSDLG